MKFNELSPLVPPFCSRRYSKRQWVILTIGLYGAFLSAACYAVQAPFFPQEAANKMVSPIMNGLVFGAFALALFVGAPLTTKLILYVNVGHLFKMSFVVTGLAMLLFGMLNKISDGTLFILVAILTRIVEGLATAVLDVAGTAILLSEFPGQASAMFGKRETMVGLGSILGPSVGGAIYELGGYSAPFFTIGGLLLAGGVSAILATPELKPSNTIPSFGLMLAAMQNLGMVVNFMTVMATTTNVGFYDANLGTYLQDFGLTPFYIGLVFMVYAAGYAICGPPFGKLCDNGYSPRKLILLGGVISLIGSLLIGPARWLPVSQNVHLTIAMCALNGVATSAKFIGSFSAMMNIVLSRKGFADDSTTISVVYGIFVSALAAGHVVGPSVGSYIVQRHNFRFASWYLVTLDLFVLVLNVFTP
ncbi:MFS-type transporter SLC18B1 [Halotydeus destructor]|nr:MFS-type transporter SLC18B1 [Halotydeus destructor]